MSIDRNQNYTPYEPLILRYRPQSPSSSSNSSNENDNDESLLNFDEIYLSPSPSPSFPNENNEKLLRIETASQLSDPEIEECLRIDSFPSFIENITYPFTCEEIAAFVQHILKYTEEDPVEGFQDYPMNCATSNDLPIQIKQDTHNKLHFTVATDKQDRSIENSPSIIRRITDLYFNFSGYLFLWESRNEIQFGYHENKGWVVWFQGNEAQDLNSLDPKLQDELKEAVGDIECVARWISQKRHIPIKMPPMEQPTLSNNDYRNMQSKIRSQRIDSIAQKLGTLFKESGKIIRNNDPTSPLRISSNTLTETRFKSQKAVKKVLSAIAFIFGCLILSKILSHYQIKFPALNLKIYKA